MVFDKPAVPKPIGMKTICIFGEICEATSAAVIPELVECEFERDNIKELHIYICSEGGYLSHCFAIIDFILFLKKQFNLKIYTYALGEIASGGFFLFLLGEKRVMFPSCRIYVHEHITVDEEPKTYSNRIKEDKTTEKALYETYLNYTAQQLGTTKRRAKTLLALDKWLSSKDIARFNILGGASNEQAKSK